MIPTCDKCGKKWRVASAKENDSVSDTQVFNESVFDSFNAANHAEDS